MASPDKTAHQMEADMRQQDINFQHAVCDAHPEWESKRPKKPKAFVMSIEDLPVVMQQMTAKTMLGAVDQIASRHSISKAELLSSDRTAHLIQPRTELVHYCTTKLGKSKSDVGRMMGCRERSTIYYYVNRAKRQLADLGVAA